MEIQIKYCLAIQLCPSFFNNKTTFNISAHGRFLFQFSFVIAPVLSFIINPGLHSLRSFTPGYKYSAPPGQGSQKKLHFV
jgi:hypothetical protein